MLLSDLVVSLNVGPDRSIVIRSNYQFAWEAKMNSHRNRSGEEGQFPFRSERICKENGQWYFHTREGRLYGPFRDMAETRRALAVFVAEAMQGSGTQKVEVGDLAVETGDEFQHMVEELLEFFRSRNASGEVPALAWARKRIDQLKTIREGTLRQKNERIDILLYAMNQDQHMAHR